MALSRGNSFVKIDTCRHFQHRAEQQPPARLPEINREIEQQASDTWCPERA